MVSHENKTKKSPILYLLVLGQGFVALLGFLSLLVLASQETSSDGSKTTKDRGSTDIRGSLLQDQLLEPLLLLLINTRHCLLEVAVVGDTTARLLTGLDNAEGQRDLALGNTVLVVEVEAGRERVVMGLLDLVQGDGSVSDGGIGSLVFVKNLDVEVSVLILDLTDIKRLFPCGVRAVRLSLGLELLVLLVIVHVDGEADIGVVLAEALWVCGGVIGRYRNGEVEEHRVGKH